MSESRLTRSEDKKMIAGVCAGLADYLSVDPVLVRLAFVVLSFATGIGIPVYIVMAIITPTETEAFFETSNEDLKAAERASGDDVDERQRNTTTLFSALLILGGLYFLLGNFNINFSFLVPIGLIAMGAWLISNR